MSQVHSIDPIIDTVINRILARSDAGIETYGMTMGENNTKSVVQWISDAQEELMDAVVYLEKVKRILGAVKNVGNNGY